MLKHFFSKQFLGFLFVGIAAAGINWATRYTLGLWVSFNWAVFAAYFFGMATAFLLNKRYVFPYSSIPVPVQAQRFIFINISFLPLVWGGSIIIRHFMDYFGINYHADEIAHAIALTLPMIITFSLYKFFAFRTENTRP